MSGHSIIARTARPDFRLEDGEKVCILGSCLCDDFAARLSEGGHEVLSNPFGPLYNPVSVLTAVRRLSSAKEFTREDCVRLGADKAHLTGSFEHYTKWARESEEEFLSDANEALHRAATFWRDCKKLILIFYTGYVWEREGKVVSNCLKRPASEFRRRLLGTDETIRAMQDISAEASDKKILTMVCPIRQRGSDCRENTLGKATLQLALHSTGMDYLPMYEIVTDELRDYSFYTDTLIHPNGRAMDIVFERFIENCKR